MYIWICHCILYENTQNNRRHHAQRIYTEYRQSYKVKYAEGVLNHNKVANSHAIDWNSRALQGKWHGVLWYHLSTAVRERESGRTVPTRLCISQDAKKIAHKRHVGGTVLSRSSANNLEMIVFEVEHMELWDNHIAASLLRQRSTCKEQCRATEEQQNT